MTYSKFCLQIVDEVDEDGSGTVDFDEFMAMMTGNEWTGNRKPETTSETFFSPFF